MRNFITITQDNNYKHYPRLVAHDSSENQNVKFKKIEIKNKVQRKLETSFVLKSLHQTNNEIQSYRIIKIQDISFRQRRKSECDGVISQKIQNIDMKYPKTTIEQHQFLFRVKDLRRRAIKGRMKTKFQKSFKKIDTKKPSQFNPLHQHTISTRDSIFGSLQDIKVYRTFAKDRTYYQRSLEKKGSDLISDSPSTPSVHIRRVTQKLGFASKQQSQQYVILQMNKFNPKSFEQLNKNSILKVISVTKETQPQTPPVIQTATLIQHKFQPYFCNHKTMNLKKSYGISSFQRIKTVF